MTLYVVATPIGNLADFSLRAQQVLASVDLIAAEDTRHSKRLLQQYQIDTPLQAYHDFNEGELSSLLVAKIKSGISVALISDAGTPLISDPGYRLVKLAREQAIDVVAIPGPSAVIAALSIAGLATDRFYFEGFLPARQGARISRLEQLRWESATLVFYESPHRLLATVEDMLVIFGGGRCITLARELTKIHEQVVQTTLADLLQQLAHEVIRLKGEFVLIVAGAVDVPELVDHRRLMSILLQTLSPKQAVHLAHQLTGQTKQNLYELAIALKQQTLSVTKNN